MCCSVCHASRPLHRGVRQLLQRVAVCVAVCVAVRVAVCVAVRVAACVTRHALCLAIETIVRHSHRGVTQLLQRVAVCVALCVACVLKCVLQCALQCVLQCVLHCVLHCVLQCVWMFM